MSARIPRARRGFTVLELLVVAAVLSALIGLILPAVLSAREAGRNVACHNNLRQLGVAFSQCHDARRALPAAWEEVTRTTTLYGWTIQLLPYLEQAELHHRVSFRPPLANLSDQNAKQMSLAVMLCPSDITAPVFDLYVENEDEEDDDLPAGKYYGSSEFKPEWIATLPTANYVGVFGTIEADDDYPAPFGDGSMIVGRRVRFADLRRGLSKTVIVGERTMAMIPSTWLGVDVLGEDAACRLVGSAMTRPNCRECDECEFASRHAGGVNFLWADGHVRTVSNQIDSAEYQMMARRQ